MIAHLRLLDDQCFTWSLQSGAEMDLVFQAGGKLYGIEFKHAEAPRTSRSFTMAFEQLKLESAAILHTGPKTWQVGDKKHAVSIQDLDQLSELLGLA
ncbi:MAG: hypothetical protein AAF514_04935 [Verrucomicrobiota bacterium]